MLLNSFSFMVMVASVALLYTILMSIPQSKLPYNRTRIANVLLLIISYYFFLSHSPAGAAILFGESVLAYFAGIIIERHRGRQYRVWLITAIVLLLLVPLSVFKYYNFVTESIVSLLTSVGFEVEVDRASWIVPLGISFFTFQVLGYVFDVYRAKEPAEKHFGTFLLFVAFFPQIASGPISRAGELIPQIRGDRNFDSSNIYIYIYIYQGVKLLLWGYFLKAVFADRVALFANPVFANYENFSGITCFIASVAYSLQIYGDFAGYSLMAIGVGRIFGFKLPDNFNRPYFAASVTEFWRRWHISLSRWLKDYVYIPLGGSRCSTSKNYRNIIVTFLVSGIWHGANWTFIVWGAIHGVVQAVEKFFRLNGTPKMKVLKVLRIAVTFLIVNFAWIFFRSSSIKSAIGFIERIFTNAPGMTLNITISDFAMIMLSVSVVFVKEIVEETLPSYSMLNNRRTAIRWLTAIALIVCTLLFGVLDAGQFIYVNF